MKNSIKIILFSLLLTTAAHAQTSPRTASDSYSGNENELVEMIDQIIDNTKNLEEYVTLQENQKYLRPIKVLSGKTKAMIMGRGSYSGRSIAMCDLLVKKVKAASDFIESRYSVNATFELAIELESLDEQLDKMID